MSSISCGIVGLPNVGKSTLFNALTDNQALVANYPFATIEPNTGVVPVLDSRLPKLAELYKTQRIVPATVTFVDIAGLVAGASQGEGLGNQFLSHIRASNAVLHIVRGFHDPNVVHVDIAPSPEKDIETINTELILADLQILQHRLPRLEKEARIDSKLKPQFETMQAAYNHLDSGTPLWDDHTIDFALLYDVQLITVKPVIYLFNLDESGLSDMKAQEHLSSLVTPHKALFVCAKLEDELRGLDKDDAQELLESYGQHESALVKVIHAAYDILGLQSFLTAGEKEVRAWTIPKGSTAPQAAGVIHTDFEKGFIAAEVVDYEDLLVAGSLVAARSAGKVRTEGKTYVMQPNDIVEFRFNVSR